jgi:hypothetical protein
MQNNRSGSRAPAFGLRDAMSPGIDGEQVKKIGPQNMKQTPEYDCGATD